MAAYRYEDPDYSRYSASIGDLLARRGDIDANRAMQVANANAQAQQTRAQAWGGAIQNIGQIAANVPGQIQQQKREQIEQQGAQQKLDREAQLTRRDQAFVGLFEMFPDGNIPAKEIASIYGPKEGLTIAAGLMEFQKLQAGAVEDPKKAAMSIGAAFKSLRSPALQQSMWPQVQQAAVKAGLVGPDDLSGEYSNELADALIAWGSGEVAAPAAAPALIQHDPTRDLRDPVTGALKVAGVPAVEKGPAVGSFEDYVKRTYGENPTPAQIVEGRKAYQQADDRPITVNTGRQGLTPNMEANTIRQLATQWTNASKQARELDRQVSIMDEGIKAARAGNLNAGGQAVLVTFQKILDPGSVVRESEFDRSREGISLMQRAQGAYERLTGGGPGIPLPELEQFATLAKEIATAQKNSRLSAIQERIGRVADRYTIPRELVFEAGPDTGGGSFVVTAPDGSTHDFASQAEADNFKRLANIP